MRTTRLLAVPGSILIFLPFVPMSWRTCSGFAGHRKHVNDVLFASWSPASSTGDDPKASPRKFDVIFIPGDAQNYVELMQRGNCAKFKEYSLDRTAELLAYRFPASSVWVIRPCRYREGLFACYDGFVSSLDVVGKPSVEYTPTLKSGPHLSSLVTHAKAQLITAAPEWGEAASGPRPVILIGFSKGTVVLNELLAELPLLHTTRALPVSAATSVDVVEGTRRFMESLVAIHWVDGLGHERVVPSSVFPTSPAAAAALTGGGGSYGTSLPIDTAMPHASSVASVTVDQTLCLPGLPLSCSLCVHGGPYQWSSGGERRTRRAQSEWFVEHAKALGFPAAVKEYYVGQAVTEDSILCHHFSLLVDFDAPPPPL